MIKRQRKLFTIKYLFVLIIFTLIFFTGWYIKKTASSNESKSFSKSSEPAIPEGWIKYDNKELRLSFAYPETWTFKDKSDEPYTALYSHYVGDLIENDGKTSVAVELVREQDGRKVRDSIDDWKNLDKKSPGMSYFGNFQKVEAAYNAFSFIQYSGGKNNIELSLRYIILPLGNEVSFVVLPAKTKQKTVIENIIRTVKVE